MSYEKQGVGSIEVRNILTLVTINDSETRNERIRKMLTGRMSMMHDLKTDAGPYNDIDSGRKKVTVRLNDRDYLEGIAEPDVLGKLHRSYRGLYWAKPGYLRPVGEFGVLERVHESVRERMEKSVYRPLNIEY